MEHRIALTNQEAFELSQKLQILSTGYVKDEYTGRKRIRLNKIDNIIEKDYETPVKGTIHRFSSLCKLDIIDNIWFEFKWTDKKQRFEIEFEGTVPQEYITRPNIPGWDILQD
jgi:hypothetical protein